MAHSLYSIEKAGRGIKQYFKQLSQGGVKGIARKIIGRTDQGRGLWNLILWPVWLVSFAFYVYASQYILEKTHFVGGPIYLWTADQLPFIFYVIPWCIGLLVSTYWYRSKYTRTHPFLGCMIRILDMSALAFFMTLLA